MSLLAQELHRRLVVRRAMPWPMRVGLSFSITASTPSAPGVRGLAGVHGACRARPRARARTGRGSAHDVGAELERVLLGAGEVDADHAAARGTSSAFSTMISLSSWSNSRARQKMSPARTPYSRHGAVHAAQRRVDDVVEVALAARGCASSG